MTMSMFASNTHVFEVGSHLAQGCGVVTLVLFVSIAIGRRFGQEPVQGQGRGPVAAALFLRWVGLALTIVGLLLMVIGWI
jgi:hypothetical protein